jgi:hypothetical protein
MGHPAVEREKKTAAWMDNNGPAKIPMVTMIWIITGLIILGGPDRMG